MESISDNTFLLLLFAVFAGGIGTAAAFLADWLEKRFPWKM